MSNVPVPLPMPPDEVCRLAQNLARNTGWPVFPMRLLPGGKKVPARRERDGGRGFHDATSDPEQIEWLWRNWPGDLIAIRTGAASGIAVLDIDPDSPAAWAWWDANHYRLPGTRAYRTRRPGGVHVYLQHRPGVGISRNPPDGLPEGVDVRGEGGCSIHWFAHGAECLDESAIAPWPDWLLAAITPKPRPAPAPYRRPADLDKAIEALLDKLAATREGNRNGLLYWTGCRLREHGINEQEALAMLGPIAQGIGLAAYEGQQTIRSAFRRAVA